MATENSNHNNDADDGRHEESDAWGDMDHRDSDEGDFRSRKEAAVAPQQGRDE